jgi:hypothetical protein
MLTSLLPFKFLFLFLWSILKSLLVYCFHFSIMLNIHSLFWSHNCSVLQVNTFLLFFVLYWIDFMFISSCLPLFLCFSFLFLIRTIFFSWKLFKLLFWGSESLFLYALNLYAIFIWAWTLLFSVYSLSLQVPFCSLFILLIKFFLAQLTVGSAYQGEQDGISG